METTDNNRQSLVDQQLVQKHLSSRTVKNKVFKLIFLACTLLGLVVLIALLTQTLIKGVSHLNLQFFTNFSSSTPSMAGVKGALIGSLWLMLSIIPLSIILGIGTAIYLEEYAKNNKFTQFVKISISNLAGVPSVVFGLLGYTLFVGGAGIEALKMGNSILAAALTMTLLILPIIIVSSQEAIRAVPNSVREASYGLGANVYVSIENGIKSLSIDDRGFARQTVKNDKHINQLNYNINERVIMLITKQQPIASDLRMMISSLKIASDLERIGDNASSIANIRLRTKITDDYVLTRLKTMGKLAMLMLKDLDQAFKKKDTVLIREIIERDEDIDDLYSHIINATYLIDNDPFVAAQAHLAARHLERIGDHIINIAESVYFYLTGTHYEQ